MDKYNPKKIEAKWSKIWHVNKSFQVDIKNAKKPFYNLAMFPYPSGEGLHMGHIIPYSGVDTYGRYLRMNGHDVFEPMGFDAFGIHSENFAIKKGIHPQKLIADTTTYFREKQMKRLGTLFDWEREVNTTDPDYYKWTQWLFIQMFKHGLAEKKKAPVTYCPSCKTVLSDEQTEVVKVKSQMSKVIPVIPAQAKSDLAQAGIYTNNTEPAGPVELSVTVCERCKTPIEKKELEQWFFKITKYAERLLNNLTHLSPDAFGQSKTVSKYDREHGINWSQKTKNAQINWIGKSEGINITYKVENTDEKIVCFTTRPDTNFGATFIVLAPEHPFVSWVLSQNAQIALNAQNQKEISAYVSQTKSKTDQDRITEGREKSGVFTGYYAVNNLNGKKLPVWISDFVLSTVGTGAVVGVPGHDKRDFEFAQKYKIPVIRVVVGSNGDTSAITKDEQVQEEEGVMINSEFLDGMDIRQATIKIMDHLEEKSWGKRITRYKLRDWCISRQRYWGPPIPMIKCETCGWQPVPESELPVLLPYIKDYKPTGDGKSPLAKAEKWLKVKCPKCGADAERETDVSDTFLDSAWYFLRYPSVGLNSKHEAQNPKQIPNSNIQNSKQKSFEFRDSNFELPWDPQITRHWLPVDMYIGGHEHAVLHLMYSRFVTMALKDMGYIDFEEPFVRFFAHGLMTSEGAKMSKSKGNVVNPNEYLDKYGSDTLRMYILFMGPYDAGSDFRMTGIAGMHKFLFRVWNLVNNCSSVPTANSPSFVPRWGTSAGKQQPVTINLLPTANSQQLMAIMHKTIKKVGEDVANLHFNTAISTLMEYYNYLSDIANSQQPIANSQSGPSKVWSDTIKTLLLLLSPFAPFITEELWQMANSQQLKANYQSIHSNPWPKYDETALVEENTTIIVQVNGKVRDKFAIATANAKNKNIVAEKALQSEKIKEILHGQKPLNTIFVPGRLINIVV